MELHVAGSLELFEDDLVHFGASLHERCSDDAERPSVFDVPGRTEEALGLLQGVRFHTTGEHLAGARGYRVVGAGQTGDGVEEDADIVSALDHAAGLLEDDLGNLHMSVSGLVEGGGDDLGIDAPLHVRHFLRALVDEQDDQICLGVVFGNGVGDILQQCRLTGFRRGDNHAALSLSNGGEEVDDPRGQIVAFAGQIEGLLREEGSQVFERHPVAHPRGIAAIDLEHLHHRVVLVSLARRADGADDIVARLQTGRLDLAVADIDIVRAVQVVVVGAAQVSKPFRHHFEHALSLGDAVEIEAVFLRLAEAIAVAVTAVVAIVAVPTVVAVSAVIPVVAVPAISIASFAVVPVTPVTPITAVVAALAVAVFAVAVFLVLVLLTIAVAAVVSVFAALSVSGTVLVGTGVLLGGGTLAAAAFGLVATTVSASFRRSVWFGVGFLGPGGRSVDGLFVENGVDELLFLELVDTGDVELLGDVPELGNLSAVQVNDVVHVGFPPKWAKFQFCIPEEGSNGDPMHPRCTTSLRHLFRSRDHHRAPSSTTSGRRSRPCSMSKRNRVRTRWNPCFPAAPGLR